MRIQAKGDKGLFGKVRGVSWWEDPRPVGKFMRQKPS